MKIDFLASYKDITKALETPVGKGVSAGSDTEFAELLADISPHGPQKKAVNQGNYTPKGELIGVPSDARDGGPMARFKFPEAPIRGPVIERLVVQAPDTGFVKQTAEGVKTSASNVPQVVRGESGVASKEAKLKNAERITQVTRLVESAGAKHGIDPALSLAVVDTESNFDSKAVSRDGHDSKGLFQLLDNTAHQLLQRTGSSQAYDAFNPETNVDLGVGYLRYLHDLFSTNSTLPNNLVTQAAANSSALEKLAVAAFNAGEGRVASAQQRAAKDGKDPSQYEQIEAYLPDTTQEYVRKIMAAKPRYEARFVG